MSETLFAALPLLIVAALLVGLLWPAVRVMPVAWGTAAAIAFVVWELPPTYIAAASIKGAMAAIEILWIVFGALVLLYTLMRSGAVDRINAGFAQISDDRRVQVILLGFFLATFMEGVAGFGTPAAVVAPLLLALGFPALAAVIAALIGHAIATVFGAVGTPIIVGFQQPLSAVEGRILDGTGLTVTEFSAEAGIYAALLNGLLGILMPLVAVAMVVYFFGEERSLKPAVGVLPLAIVSGIAFAVPYVGAAYLIGPELPSLFASMLGGGVVVGLLRAGFLEPSDDWEFPDRETWPDHWVGTIEPGGEEAKSEAGTGDDGSIASMGLLRAWSPYIILSVLLIATRVVDPIAAFLQQGPFLAIGWDVFGTGLEGAIRWAYVPGTWLLASALIAIPLFGMDRQQVTGAWGEAAGKIVSPAVVLMFVIAMVEIMLNTDAATTAVDASMIVVLADSTASTVGAAYPLVAPVVGMIGSFVAGSITVSNITFAAFQFEVATALGMPATILVAAQTIGAAIGNTIAIHNVIAALATVGLVGATGRVVRLNLIPVAYYLVAGGLLTTLGVYVIWPGLF
ncbi:L-lactate permease [Halohasta salina]|uniref:L-lactate permease n=1 Tax=Halohasta salina TaxID=2961621 RepID=UPI0020A4396D|nr:L-lactate permease [Halohasta salina]